MTAKTSKTPKKPRNLRTPAKGPFMCYALQNKITKKTYTGQTNNFARRLRQHNGELAGGARTTTRSKECGRWIPIFVVCGFQTIRAVLQFEIAMKKRKVPKGFLFTKTTKTYTRGPSGRVRQLEYLLSLGKLNGEEHSPFARNGIYVECYISKDEYLKMAKMNDVDFTTRRRDQRVEFRFK